MLRASLAACTLFLLVAHAQDLTKAHRVALVIGNSNYTQLPKLPSAALDAAAISAALKNAGFDVVTVNDFTVPQFFTVGVQEFEKHLHPGDVCVVYYAGYAVQKDGDSFLLPVNFKAQDTGQMQDRAYLFALLPETLEAHGVALKMFIVEGPPPINADVAGTTAGLANPQIGDKETQKTTFIAAGRLGDTVPPASSGVDLLTRMAVKAINEQKLELEPLFIRIKNDVLEAAGAGKQVPFYDSSAGGVQFFFHEPEKMPPPPTGGTPPPEWPRQGAVVQNTKDHEEYTWIKGQKFWMGCVPNGPKCDSAENPRHEVTLNKGFWMGKNEVQVDSYQHYVAANKLKMPSGPLYDSHWKVNNAPIVDVRWEDAKGYCTWAGGRLPTEAEWEFAARGGKQNETYPMNSEQSRDAANFEGKLGNDIYEYAAPVRKFLPNSYGLFDMAGNVWEWVNDVFGPYSAAPANDPKGPPGGSGHVIRGGSWDSDPKVHLRISYRKSFGKDGPNIGFRCVIDDTPESRKLLPQPAGN